MSPAPPRSDLFKIKLMRTITDPPDGGPTVLLPSRMPVPPSAQPCHDDPPPTVPRRPPSPAWLTAGALLWLLSNSAALAVDTIPVPVSGHVRFSNTDPSFPAIFGLRAIAVSASSPAALRSASSDYEPASDPSSADYRLLVDAQGAPPIGLDYQLSYVLYGVGTAGSSLRALYDLPGPHVSVGPGPGITGVNAAECAGIFHVRFLDAAGLPVTVAGGTLGTIPPQAQLTLSPGSSADDFVVRGDTNFRVTATITTGTGDHALSFNLFTNVTSVCNHVVPINFVVPTATRLGALEGELDMVGEIEARWGNADIGDPANTRMVAAGPGGNLRTQTLPLRSVAGGVMESSGHYTLPNLLPSGFTIPPTPYTVGGEMGLRHFRQFEYFGTPKLGLGLNPAPTVIAGVPLDLGGTFVMTPGFVEGTLTLTGPRESSGSTYQSPLRGLQFSTDGEADGLPIRSIYGNFGSIIMASGVDRRAAGATYSAAGGQALASFDEIGRAHV